MAEEIFYESHRHEGIEINDKLGGEIVAEVGITQQDLDEIVFKVARDFVERKAIKGSIEDLDQATTNEVIDDVVFTVEKYMEYMNDYMAELRRQAIAK